MDYIRCEQAGVSPKHIQAYLTYLQDHDLFTHSVIMAKGDHVFFEKYYAPFHKDFYHRQYSSSKSFVSLAVGCAIDDGLIALDDCIVDYFPEEAKNVTDENLKAQTIRHMLTMCTAQGAMCANWFIPKTEDRVRFYFETKNPQSVPPGTIYEYDSCGSFILGALVERVTGKPFMEYLYEKCFKKIGVSPEARCLQCPGGHSWGDSGVLCTSMDFMKVARFVMNEGAWNGEQLLSKDYLQAAVSNLVGNGLCFGKNSDYYGYGYQFWRTRQNSYFMNGAGGQLAICVPDHDLILIYNGNNMHHSYAKSIIINGFFDLVVNQAEKDAIALQEAEYQALMTYADSLKLKVAADNPHHPNEDKINGKEYTLAPNPMGISKLRFVFDGDEGRMEYTNEQGDKVLHMGRACNYFSKFPQEGYSKEIGSVPAPGNYYDCATSFSWCDTGELMIQVQIIDTYLAQLYIQVAFRDDEIGIKMCPYSEYYLLEYSGFAGGKLSK